MKYNRSLVVIIAGLIGLTVVMRLMPHPPNMTPVSALALLSGAVMPRRWALATLLLAIIISDLIIGIHGLVLYTWGSFVLIGLIGHYLLSHSQNVFRLFGVSIVSSSLFFVISNFGVWAQGWLYPRTGAGFVSAYVNAVPFFRNMLLGDLIFGGMLFGGYALVKSLSLELASRRNQTSNWPS